MNFSAEDCRRVHNPDCHRFPPLGLQDEDEDEDNEFDEDDGEYWDDGGDIDYHLNDPNLMGGSDSDDGMEGYGYPMY